MLGRTSYSRKQIAQNRARTARQLEALAAAEVPEQVASEILANMVVALELAYVHRVRKAEGKDGNPLNEVRLLAFSLLEHDGILTADPTIRYDPARAISGLAIGDPIVIGHETFGRLAEGFYAEIEKKYPEPA